ncbi:DUF1801 domain-containing protein [Micromonospora sp. 4G57]|uniref:DUF1801 domain-containing protein n=1 Tax=Micromonospora sicca TaxID=2202420 RepID=A0ABU5JG55_9ACTN|nr:MULTISPECIES: DUF1801 domain-containing protein [unclassified Micromonospora]MDZ5445488.1 DUF1801 domain-containing protein [Micromonospora sp. 4G57]MDZ5491580.1 DUF1801 domain-containing protein [Micromonospora sp. 4G53]
MNTVTDYLTGLDAPQREIGEKLRPVIDAALPDATGAMWHGHPTWSLGERPGQRPVCLLKAYPSYVTFGLWRGREVADPSGRLTLAARQMAAVKLRTVDEVDPALFADWLRRAYELETR